LRACIDIRPVTPAVPPTAHDETATVPPPLQSAGTAPVQQNPQQVILPATQNLQPVVLPPDQLFPAETVPQNQQEATVLSVVENLPLVLLAADQHQQPSAAVHTRNTAETQQLTTGEDATAAEQYSLLLDDHQEGDPDPANNEQLRFDAETSGIAGLDWQHDDSADKYHRKWLRYISEKEALMGAPIIKGQGLNAITWTVRSDMKANIPKNINNEFRNVGVK